MSSLLPMEDVPVFASHHAPGIYDSEAQPIELDVLQLPQLLYHTRSFSHGCCLYPNGTLATLDD
jgi:hypothetical protein